MDGGAWRHARLHFTLDHSAPRLSDLNFLFSQQLLHFPQLRLPSPLLLWAFLSEISLGLLCCSSSSTYWRLRRGLPACLLAGGPNSPAACSFASSLISQHYEKVKVKSLSRVQLFVWSVALREIRTTTPVSDVCRVRILKHGWVPHISTFSLWRSITLYLVSTNSSPWAESGQPGFAKFKFYQKRYTHEKLTELLSHCKSQKAEARSGQRVASLWPTKPAMLALWPSRESLLSPALYFLNVKYGHTSGGESILSVRLKVLRKFRVSKPELKIDSLVPWLNPLIC